MVKPRHKQGKLVSATTSEYEAPKTDPDASCIHMAYGIVCIALEYSYI